MFVVSHVPFYPTDDGLIWNYEDILALVQKYRWQFSVHFCCVCFVCLFLPVLIVSVCVVV